MTQSTLHDFESAGVECPTCDRSDFASEMGMKVHHKAKHGESIAGVDVECPQCGDEFNVFGSRLERSENVFCSVSCEMKHHGGHAEKKDHPEVECDWCGDVFRVKPARSDKARFCSRDCFGAWHAENRSGEDSHAWKGGKSTRECATCGEEFSFKSFREDTARFCSYSCYGEWISKNRTGQDNPTWAGGKGLIDAVKKQLSPAFYTVNDKQRNDECYKCGATENLDTHHIVPVSCGGDNGAWNFMTLCDSCHRGVEAYCRKIPEFDPVLIE